MGFFNILSSVGKAIGSVAISALKSFNPFKDKEYQSASHEDRGRIERQVTDIANDKTLDHEYRMEAQRVLVQIESYRHAEELARIDGTTKITIVQIEATKEIVIAKIDVIKEGIIRASHKEIALISAMGSSPELANVFLERLDSTTHDIKCLSDKADLYGGEVQNLVHLIQNSKVEAIEYKKSQVWAEKLWEWANKNNISNDKLPRFLDDLTQLESLNLDDNSLTEIPKEIGNLTQLKNLRLSRNSLTEIPKEIGNLTQLEILNLNDNSLTEIPKEIGNLTQLKNLRLSRNSLTEIPKEIGNLTQLEYLYLNDNNLTGIPKEIADLTQLISLYLDDNCPTGVSALVIKRIPGLPGRPNKSNVMPRITTGRIGRMILGRS